jgi:hypothetical protein
VILSRLQLTGFYQEAASPEADREGGVALDTAKHRRLHRSRRKPPRADGSQATGSAAAPAAPPEQDWCDALLDAGLIRDTEGTWPEDLSWTEDLRRFLAEEPSIQAAARLLL